MLGLAGGQPRCRIMLTPGRLERLTAAWGISTDVLYPIPFLLLAIAPSELERSAARCTLGADGVDSMGTKDGLVA